MKNSKQRPKRKPYSQNKKTWKFYYAGDKRYFFQVYNRDPTIVACPIQLRPYLQQSAPIAHTSYASSKYGFITTYLIACEEDELIDLAGKNKKFLRVRDVRYENHPEEIDRGYQIYSKHSLQGDMERYLIQMLRDDIMKLFIFNLSYEVTFPVTFLFYLFNVFFS